MSASSNTSVLFRGYVEQGTVSPSNFEVAQLPVPKAEELKEGEVIVQLVYLSVDPYMRGRMRNTKGYFVGPFQPGQPLDGGCIGKITSSRASHLPEGAHVSGFLKGQQYQVVGAEAAAALKPLELSPDVQLSAYMGALGMVGATAYCSLAKIGKPKAGETAFVSGAAGAVGCLVGQLLKNVYGCRVVGSAGSDEKVAFLKRLGYDDAFNYKTTSTAEALDKLCPKGIDVYYDNVGGETLEAALDHMNTYGRIVACGSISQYDSAPEDRHGVKNLFHVVTKRLLFQGFIVGDFLKDMGADYQRDMRAYLKEGKVTVEEVVVEGLENAGNAFCDMMKGANIGKMIVHV